MGRKDARVGRDGYNHMENGLEDVKAECLSVSLHIWSDMWGQLGGCLRAVDFPVNHHCTTWWNTVQPTMPKRVCCNHPWSLIESHTKTVWVNVTPLVVYHQHHRSMCLNDMVTPSEPPLVTSLLWLPRAFHTLRKNLCQVIFWIFGKHLGNTPNSTFVGPFLTKKYIRTHFFFHYHPRWAQFPSGGAPVSLGSQGRKSRIFWGDFSSLLSLVPKRAIWIQKLSAENSVLVPNYHRKSHLCLTCWWHRGVILHQGISPRLADVLSWSHYGTIGQLYHESCTISWHVWGLGGLNKGICALKYHVCNGIQFLTCPNLTIFDKNDPWMRY